MLVELSGTFVKIAFANDIDHFLMHSSPDRSAGRFNRPGQDALYLSKNEESARAALTKYIKNDDTPRVLIELEIENCCLLDLRHPDAEEWLAASRGNWQKAILDGAIPASWDVADSIRAADYAGVIDPSRKRSDLWHITLFR